MTHFKTSKNDQIGVNNSIKETEDERLTSSFFITITNSQESISKGDKSKEQHNKEILHVSDNQNDKTDKITERLEDSEEIEELEPHEEDSDSLQDSFVLLANIQVQRVDQQDCQDSRGGDHINVIPNGREIGNTIISHLLDFISQEIASEKT